MFKKIQPVILNVDAINHDNHDKKYTYL
jgi:hypothetical protein